MGRPRGRLAAATATIEVPAVAGGSCHAATGLVAAETMAGGITSRGVGVSDEAHFVAAVWLRWRCLQGSLGGGNGQVACWRFKCSCLVQGWKWGLGQVLATW